MSPRRVKLWKAEETPERVVYLYGPTQNQVGRLSINKTDGRIHGEGVSGMSEEISWHYFGTRAKALAERLFARGEYPDEIAVGA